jgi:hypothetical protein
MEKNLRQQLSVYNEMVLTYTPFFKRMATIFKIDPSTMNFTKICSLYDTIKVDRYLNRKLPEEFTEDDLKNIEHLFSWYMHITRNGDLAKAFSTFALNQVISHFDGKIKNPKEGPKWVTISSFDGDIVSVHNQLNIASASCIE